MKLNRPYFHFLQSVEQRTAIHEAVGWHQFPSGLLCFNITVTLLSVAHISKVLLSGEGIQTLLVGRAVSQMEIRNIFTWHKKRKHCYIHS